MAPAAVKKQAVAQATKSSRGFWLTRYFSEIINELKKVVWLTRREVAYLTGLVILVTIITGIILGSLDYGFTQLIGKVFIGG
jgi:preprotein translocase SecE subunit